jgi:rubrerythrin
MAFDITTYTRNAAPVAYEDLDYGAFERQPLSPGALRCLRYMSDIESHTVCYLRDLLVTPSHADPDVTAFLTMWAYEEFWHGEALAKVLEVHGIPTGNAHIRGVRERLGWRDRLAPITQSLAANIVGNDFIAVHMTWGAINEWSTHAGYARLAEREEHPVLAELLKRIMKQESKHVAFYVSQARDRLALSRKAQKLTRFALKKFWEPVGASVMPRAETAHLLSYLLGGEHSAQIDRIDEKIDQLPGLSGLGLVRRAATGYGVA